jgi:dTDP-4-dehydrorhamnose reductase
MPKPDLIVNAAAYTAIDKAEREPFVAEAVNSEAVAILAMQAVHWDIPMIHFSTSHVFSGWRRTLPYREDEHPVAASLHGWTKLEGEIRLRRILEKHLIFRLSGLYGARHKNFFTALLTQRHKDTALRVVKDQIISPNWTPLVAEAIAEVIRQLAASKEIQWGTYHLSGNGYTSPYAFARLISQKVSELWDTTMPPPVPITLRESRTAAKRPKYSVLDSRRFNETFRYILPNWQEQFLRFFGGLHKNPTGR